MASKRAPLTAAAARAFFALTPERVLDAVEVGGRRCTGRFVVLNSWENRVYQLELDDGSYVVGKFYRPARWSEDALLDEHDLLLDLAEEGLPIVPPLELRDGDTLGTVDGIRFALFPRLGGRAAEDLDDEQLRTLGYLLARIHHVAGQYDAEHRPRLDPDTYCRAEISLLISERFARGLVASRLRDAALRLAELADPFWVGLPMQRIHGDCHLGNLLMTPKGPHFLDFDDLCVGPVVQDLWLLWGGRDAWGQRRRDVLIEGYDTWAPFPTSQLRLVEVLRGFRYMRYAGWIARRWEDPAFRSGFPYFGTEAYWDRLALDVQEQVGLVMAEAGC
jgi:Ser/Thr protein kinase RdoA (MazF antagonist)